MNLLALVTHHGYATTMVMMFLASCGLPLPLSIVLLAAGANAHHGALNLGMELLCATLAALIGDTLMYFGGRYTGWWLLAGICRLSTNPEDCIFGSAKQFYTRGPKTLLVAKFIPGVSTVAAALAGSLNMKPSRFLKLDVLGAAFYVVLWSMIGYTFSHLLRHIIAIIEQLGHITAIGFTLLIIGYAIWLTYNWLHDKRFKHIERVAAFDLFQALRYEGHDKLVVIADVRSHGYYDPGMQRIKNSIRVEPARLKEELIALREFMAPECEVYLYCSCAHEATSVRVAYMLEQADCKTKVIQGGLRAWVKAGGPTEPVPAADVEHLPRFD
jgi:membrane protein DedA with SNARE-associated domain/rhodanese-related sulfurtransferase